MYAAPASEAAGKEPQDSSLATTGPDSDKVKSFWRYASKAEDAEGHTKLQDFLDALAVFRAGVFGLLLDTSSNDRNFCPAKSQSALAGEQRKMAKLFTAHICLWIFGILKLPTELEEILKRTPPYQPTGNSAGFTSNPFSPVFDVRPFYRAVGTAIVKGAAQAMDHMSIYTRSLPLCRSRLNTRPAMEKYNRGVNQLIMVEEICLTLLATRLTMLSLQRAGLEKCVLLNMVTIIAVSNDANVISAKFVIEPLLVITAVWKWAKRSASTSCCTL